MATATPKQTVMSKQKIGWGLVTTRVCAGFDFGPLRHAVLARGPDRAHHGAGRTGFDLGLKRVMASIFARGCDLMEK
jgi:hypothetical protein